MLPFAPGRLSITTGCPSASLKRGPTMRASVSAGPPGGTATIMRIGFEGYGCATTEADINTSSKNPMRDN
jgi:hypothetical protein